MLGAIDNFLETIKKGFYLVLIFTIYFFYFLVLVGIIPRNYALIDVSIKVLHTFICLFLMIRFNPFRKHELREFDANLIFAAGAILFINMGLGEYMNGRIVKLVESNDMKIF